MAVENVLNYLAVYFEFLHDEWSETIAGDSSLIEKLNKTKALRSKTDALEEGIIRLLDEPLTDDANGHIIALMGRLSELELPVDKLKILAGDVIAYAMVESLADFQRGQSFERILKTLFGRNELLPHLHEVRKSILEEEQLAINNCQSTEGKKSLKGQNTEHRFRRTLLLLTLYKGLKSLNDQMIKDMDEEFE